MSEQDEKFQQALAKLERDNIQRAVTGLLAVGLRTDGAQHKQWALWNIAETLGVTHLMPSVQIPQIQELYRDDELSTT